MDLPSTHAKKSCTLTVDGVRQLLAGCAGDRPADIRDRAIITLATRTGLRRGGIAGIDLADYQPPQLQLTVTLKDAKGRREASPAASRRRHGCYRAICERGERPRMARLLIAHWTSHRASNGITSTYPVLDTYTHAPDTSHVPFALPRFM